MQSAVAPLNFMTIKEAVPPSRIFFPKLEFFAGFSLYILVINIAGRISEAAIGGAEGAQSTVLRVSEPKKTGARSAC